MSWIPRSGEFRRDYFLHYMLDVESRGVPPLLDLERFENPFGYEPRIGTGSVGEIRPVKVDLVETFNLENLRREDEMWKVRLTEEFLGRMFDVRDV